MIVLNGAQGLSEVLAQALSQGVAGLHMARSLLSNTGNGNVNGNGTGNGTAETDAHEAATPDHP
jgi:hypothetical protein